MVTDPIQPQAPPAIPLLDRLQSRFRGMQPDESAALIQGVDNHIASQQQPAEASIPGMVGVKPSMLQPSGVQPAGMQTPGAIPTGPQAAAPFFPGAIPVPSQPLASPKPPAGQIPIPTAAPTASQNELARVEKPALLSSDPLSHTKADTGLPGYSQIKSPWARIPLGILDAVGSGLFPNIAMGIPGTSAHHQLVVNRDRAAVGDEESERAAADKSRQEQATTAKTEADVPLETAQAAEANARAESLLHPPGSIKEEQLLYDKGGAPVGYRDEHGKYYGPDDPALPPGVKDVLTASRVKPLAPSYHQQPDGSIVSLHYDPTSGKSTSEVVYKGDPKVKTDLAKLEIGGEQHSVIVNSETGATIKDLGKTGEKAPTVNVNAGISALDRESTHYGKTHEKNVGDANSQLEKINEAKSLITTGTAESQALAVPKVMTALISGQGSGVRITQAELNAIAAARGIKGDFQAWISRMSSGEKLSPEQSRQLAEVLDTAASRIVQKRQIANEALNGINGAKSREEMIQFDKAAREKLSAFEDGGQKQAKSYSQSDVDAAVTAHPGSNAKQIEDAFKAKGWVRK